MTKQRVSVDESIVKQDDKAKKVQGLKFRGFKVIEEENVTLPRY